jgi:hypothetical protein
MFTTEQYHLDIGGELNVVITVFAGADDFTLLKLRDVINVRPFSAPNG